MSTYLGAGSLVTTLFQFLTPAKFYSLFVALQDMLGDVWISNDNGEKQPIFDPGDPAYGVRFTIERSIDHSDIEWIYGPLNYLCNASKDAIMILDVGNKYLGK